MVESVAGAPFFTLALITNSLCWLTHHRLAAMFRSAIPLVAGSCITVEVNRSSMSGGSWLGTGLGVGLVYKTKQKLYITLSVTVELYTKA